MFDFGEYENDEKAIEMFYSWRHSKLDSNQLMADVGRWVDLERPFLANKEFKDLLKEIAGYMAEDQQYNWGPDMTKEQFALYVHDAIDEVAYVARKFWLRKKCSSTAKKSSLAKGLKLGITTSNTNSNSERTSQKKKMKNGRSLTSCRKKKRKEN